MSKILGRLIICDRCGKESFQKHTGEKELDGGFTRWDTFEGLKDWGARKGKDLCPDCFREWNRLEIGK